MTFAMHNNKLFNLFYPNFENGLHHFINPLLMIDIF